MVTDRQALTVTLCANEERGEYWWANGSGERTQEGRRRRSAGMLPLWECFPLSITFFFPPHKALFKLLRATQSGHSSPRGQGTEPQRHRVLYTDRPFPC